MAFCIPSCLCGLAPMESLTKINANHCDLLPVHAPDHVLDKTIKIDQRFQSRSWLLPGQFLCFNDAHSSLVSNIQHLSTGYLFVTVFKADNNVWLDGIYNHIFDSVGHFNFSNDKFTFDKCLVYHQPLLDEWLGEP